MRKPHEVYTQSARRYPKQLLPLTYPLHDCVRTVSSLGAITIPKWPKKCFIGRALAGERLGMRELADDLWLLSFASMDLGTIDVKTGKFREHLRSKPEAQIH